MVFEVIVSLSLQQAVNRSEHVSLNETFSSLAALRTADGRSTSLCCWSTSSASESETSWWDDFTHSVWKIPWCLVSNEVTSHLSIHALTGDQQRHGSAPPDCVLRGDLSTEVQVLGASAGRGLFPATVRWANLIKKRLNDSCFPSFWCIKKST